MADADPTATGFLVRNEKAVLGVLVGALLVVGTIGALDDPFDDVPETDPFELEEKFPPPEFPEPPEFDFDEPTIPEFEGPDFDFEEPPPIEVPAPEYQF